MATLFETTSTTTSTSSSVRRPGYVLVGADRPPHLWRTGALAAIVAALADIVIRIGAGAVGAVPADYALLQPARIVAVCILAALAATLLLAALARRSRRPTPIFRVIATVFLVVSFAGPLGVDAGAAIVATMLLMHVVTAAIVVAVLTPPRRTARQQIEGGAGA